MNFFNSSKAFQAIVRQLHSASLVSEPVLLTGEVGTGKRQSAMSIHRASERRNGRFVTLNCLGLADAKFELEMFGSVTDSFELTRKGALSLAEGGTLYLHEVAELAPRSQALLVRFLETGVYCPINGYDHLSANARVICSSSLPLENLVESGRFRNDLYHLLTALCIHMPNLNDRLEDIPLLVQGILRDMGLGGQRTFAPDAMLPLFQHSFNGNLVELRNIVFRLAHNFSDREITAEQVRFALRGDAHHESAFREASRQPTLKSDYMGLEALGAPVRAELKAPDAQADKPNTTKSNAVPHESMQAFDALSKPMRLRDLDGAISPEDRQILASTEPLAPPLHPGAPAAMPVEPVPGNASSVFQPKYSTAGGPLSLREQEKEYFRQLLEFCKGDKKQAAEIAGLTLRTLYRKLEEL